MQRNLNPANKIPFVYNLTDAEMEQYYRGAGNATIVVGIGNEIIACNYEDKDNNDADFLAAMAQPGTKWMEGVMSCGQFCCDLEGQITGT